MVDVKITFKSLKNLVDYTNAHEANSVFKGKRQSSQVVAPQGDYFHSCRTYGEAQDLLLYGDRESLEKIKTELHRLPATETAPRRVLTKSVCGLMPSVPDYLKGLPRAMYSYKTEPRRASIKNIIYLANNSGGYSAEEVAKASARLLSVIRGIEMAGTRVNLWVLWSSSERSQTFACIVKIKDASQTANWLKMAFCLVNPDFKRRICFRLLEVCPDVKAKAFAKHYGRIAEKASPIVLDILSENSITGTVIDFYDCRSVENIKRLLQKENK